MGHEEDLGASRLGNVRVEMGVELDRKGMTLREARSLRKGDVVPLDKLAGEAFDIRVNGRLFAEGEVVVVADRIAVRITKMRPLRQEVGA